MNTGKQKKPGAGAGNACTGQRTEKIGLFAEFPHKGDVAGSAGGDGFLAQDREGGLRHLLQHGEAACIVHAGILQAGGVQGAVRPEVLAFEVDGGDLVAVPAAHLVPDAALRVQRSVLRADVARNRKRWISGKRVI